MKQFNNWWFGWQTGTALGLFRIVMGFWLFLNLAMVATDFDAWFTEHGFVPLAEGQKWLEPEFRLGLLQSVTNETITATVFALTLVFSFMTMIGLWTRVSAILMAIGYVSLHHRNPIILHSGDTLMRMSVLYLAVAPCGVACSLDRLRKIWRGGGTVTPSPLISVWPQRIIQIQLAIVYGSTFWWKMYGTMWRDGTATYYPSTLHEFDRFWVPSFVEQNVYLVKFATYSTLFLEFALATLVFWKPARKWLLLGGLGMHAFIEYRYNIPLFSFVICTCYIAHYDSDEIQAWAKRLAQRVRRFQVTWRLPTLRPGPLAALNAADPLDLVKIEPGSPQTGGAKAFVRLPIAWALTPLGWAWLVRKSQEKP